MFKSKRVFMRNIISSYVPVIVVLVIAVSFLNRSFQMLESRNRSVLQVQVEGILHDMEREMTMSRQVANQICVDSALSRDKMLDHGLPTVAGVNRINMYKLHLNPQVFLTYVPEQLITKDGTCTRAVYAEYALDLTEESIAAWEQAFESKESQGSFVLEDVSGRRYFLVLYYYPQSRQIDEKWIGFVFSEHELSRILQSTAQNLKGTAMLSWNGQAISFADYSDTTQEDKEAFLEAVRTGQAGSNYAVLECGSANYNMNIVMAFDNSILVDELADEAVKMFAVGLIVVFLVSYFIWSYGKYRYRFLHEIKQLAVSGRPELDASTEADEYEIIRTVLKQTFGELKSKNEDLALFKKKAKRQMSWMLLCAPPVEGMDASQILEGYGIENKGCYYCTMVFCLQEALSDEQINVDDIADVLLSGVFKENDNHYFVVGLSLMNKDVNHNRRQEIARMIMERLAEEEIGCRAVSCGLVYEDLSQFSTSKQEAWSVLQTLAVSGGRKVLFFDKLTHLPNEISSVIEDNLNQFTEALRYEDGAEASSLLKQLLANAGDEAQLSYIKYKLVHNTIDVMYEMEASSEYMENLDRLVYLDAQGFEKQMSELLSKMFMKLKKKDVTDTQILSYIEQNYSNSEISMRNVADHFGISERSVSRVLKKSINKTYKEYLSEIRLKHACKLLLETDLDVRVIIKEIGYYDVSSFNRLFKQAFQMTPMEYRTEYGKKQGDSEYVQSP